MKTICIFVLYFTLFSTSLLGQVSKTTLSGKVIDSKTGQAMIFGTVAVYKNDKLITGTETDFEGNYNVELEAGEYEVEAYYVGFETAKIEHVLIVAGHDNKLDISIFYNGKISDIYCPSHSIRLIQQDNTTQGSTITAKDIKNMPTRDINTLVIW